MIVDGNATNADGKPIDVLANLRFKKELAAVIIPGVLQMLDEIREGMLLSGEPAIHALDEYERKMRDISRAFGLDPEPKE